MQTRTEARNGSRHTISGFSRGTKVTQKRRDDLFHARLGSGGSWVNQVPRTRSFAPDQTPIRAQNVMDLRVKPRR